MWKVKTNKRMIITTLNINDYKFENNHYAAKIADHDKILGLATDIVRDFRSYKLADTIIDNTPLKEWLSKNYPNGICQEELEAILQKQPEYDEFFSIFYDDWKEIVDSTIEKVQNKS